MNLLARATEYRNEGAWRAKLPDDRDVWDRVCRGDGDAFEVLYQEHGGRLVSFLTRVTGDRQAAEDVMQETFAQIWRRPNAFQPERGTFRAYLFGAARKRAAEWWRKKARENGIADSTSCPVENMTETSSLVGNAFQQLPEEQRALLWLREVEGQSYQELASILEVPVGTIRSRLFAAREELRKVWSATAKVTEESI